jgi:hypothetical protein
MSPTPETTPNPALAVAGPPRVMLIAFTYKIPDRVRNYARELLDDGVLLDLVILSASAWSDDDPDGWREISQHPRLRLLALTGAEHGHPVRRAERVIVHCLPRKALLGTRRLARKVLPLRPLDKPVGKLQDGHDRVASAFHRRAFMPVYKVFRPRLLAGLFDKRLGDVDLSGLDRIVAADVYAVTLGWRLARRHPSVVATTSLVARPYATLAAGDERAEEAAAVASELAAAENESSVDVAAADVAADEDPSEAEPSIRPARRP